MPFLESNLALIFLLVVVFDFCFTGRHHTPSHTALPL